MKNISLVGASVEALSLLKELKYNVEIVIDINFKAEKWNGLRVVQNEEKASNLKINKKVIVAIDNPINRKRAFNNLKKYSFQIESISFGFFSEESNLGEGYFIQRFANFSPASISGIGLRLNIGANIMHNVILGDFVTVAPNAVILGNVKIGNNVYVGANSTILPGIKIGDNVIIGAGSIVTKDISSNIVVKGNPAR